MSSKSKPAASKLSKRAPSTVSKPELLVEEEDDREPADDD